MVLERQRRAYISSTSEKQRELTGKWYELLKPQTLLHTSSTKTIPPNPSQTVTPIGDHLHMQTPPNTCILHANISPPKKNFFKTRIPNAHQNNVQLNPDIKLVKVQNDIPISASSVKVQWLSLRGGLLGDGYHSETLETESYRGSNTFDSVWDAENSKGIIAAMVKITHTHKTLVK